MLGMKQEIKGTKLVLTALEQCSILNKKSVKSLAQCLAYESFSFLFFCILVD